jgi:hypothetical protein
MTPTKPESIEKAGAPRKKYESPRLEIYGNIHQITRAIGTHGKTDNATTKKLNKTG